MDKTATYSVGATGKMFIIFNGSEKTMQGYAERGVRGINPKTRKWQFIDKKATYKVVVIVSSEGTRYAELWSDKNLYAIAEEKGLII